MKKCPFCAEEIQDEAIVCRYCGRDLLPKPEPKIQPKKNKIPIGLIILIVIALCLAAVFIIHGLTSSSDLSVYGQPTLAPQDYDVIYQITGTASDVSVTYSNAQGGTEQGVYQVPIKITLKMAPGSFVYISAQNQNDSGTVTCTILVNGIEYKTSTSQGAYVIASCSGSLD